MEEYVILRKAEGEGEELFENGFHSFEEAHERLKSLLKSDKFHYYEFYTEIDDINNQFNTNIVFYEMDEIETMLILDEEINLIKKELKDRLKILIKLNNIPFGIACYDGMFLYYISVRK